MEHENCVATNIAFAAVSASKTVRGNFFFSLHSPAFLFVNDYDMLVTFYLINIFGDRKPEPFTRKRNHKQPEPEIEIGSPNPFEYRLI